MNRFTATLERLKEEGRFRALKPAHEQAGGIDFTSNDYLGFSVHPELRAAGIAALQGGIGIGAGGARLLRGNHPHHEKLEWEAARFFGAPRALFFASGFLANHALMTALPQRRDVILFDAHIHASLRDGIQANPANHLRMPHNDLSAFEDALKRHDTSGDSACWVVTESVFSMDGDMAPITELLNLCEKYHAYLVVDEAHATGVFGEAGKGLTHGLQSPQLITLHTCGKALGVAGALICAEEPIIETLINRARPFIYSTAPMPLQAALVSKALELCASADSRRARLFHLCELARKHFPAYISQSPIIPIILGEEQKALGAAQALQAQGFDVRAIRPPTVAAGSSRLRITLNALLNDEDVLSLARALHALKDKAAA